MSEPVRNRVVGLRFVRASELIPSPKNWRLHPPEQKSALRGALKEIGYADALIARETPDGLMLIDGHLRRETTPDQEVPVLVVDLSEQEADKLLAVLDPLAGMAETDEQLFKSLVSNIDPINSEFATLIKSISESKFPSLLESESSKPELSVEKEFILLVNCDSESELAALFQELTGRGKNCKLLS